MLKLFWLVTFVAVAAVTANVPWLEQPDSGFVHAGCFKLSYVFNDFLNLVPGGDMTQNKAGCMDQCNRRDALFFAVNQTGTGTGTGTGTSDFTCKCFYTLPHYSKRTSYTSCKQGDDYESPSTRGNTEIYYIAPQSAECHNSNAKAIQGKLIHSKENRAPRGFDKILNKFTTFSPFELKPNGCSTDLYRIESYDTVSITKGDNLWETSADYARSTKESLSTKDSSKIDSSVGPFYSRSVTRGADSTLNTHLSSKGSNSKGGQKTFTSGVGTTAFIKIDDFDTIHSKITFNRQFYNALKEYQISDFNETLGRHILADYGSYFVISAMYGGSVDFSFDLETLGDSMEGMSESEQTACIRVTVGTEMEVDSKKIEKIAEGTPDSRCEKKKPACDSPEHKAKGPPPPKYAGSVSGSIGNKDDKCTSALQESILKASSDSRSESTQHTAVGMQTIWKGGTWRTGPEWALLMSDSSLYPKDPKYQFEYRSLDALFDPSKISPLMFKNPADKNGLNEEAFVQLGTKIRELIATTNEQAYTFLNKEEELNCTGYSNKFRKYQFYDHPLQFDQDNKGSIRFFSKYDIVAKSFETSCQVRTDTRYEGPASIGWCNKHGFEWAHPEKWSTRKKAEELTTFCLFQGAHRGRRDLFGSWGRPVVPQTLKTTYKSIFNSTMYDSGVFTGIVGIPRIYHAEDVDSIQSNSHGFSNNTGFVSGAASVHVNQVTNNYPFKLQKLSVIGRSEKFDVVNYFKNEAQRSSDWTKPEFCQSGDRPGWVGTSEGCPSAWKNGAGGEAQSLKDRCNDPNVSFCGVPHPCKSELYLPVSPRSLEQVKDPNHILHGNPRYWYKAPENFAQLPNALDEYIWEPKNNAVLDVFNIDFEKINLYQGPKGGDLERYPDAIPSAEYKTEIKTVVSTVTPFETVSYAKESHCFQTQAWKPRGAMSVKIIPYAWTLLKGYEQNDPMKPIDNKENIFKHMRLRTSAVPFPTKSWCCGRMKNIYYAYKSWGIKNVPHIDYNDRIRDAYNLDKYFWNWWELGDKSLDYRTNTYVNRYPSLDKNLAYENNYNVGIDKVYFRETAAPYSDPQLVNSWWFPWNEDPVTKVLTPQFSSPALEDRTWVKWNSDPPETYGTDNEIAWFMEQNRSNIEAGDLSSQNYDQFVSSYGHGRKYGYEGYNYQIGNYRQEDNIDQPDEVFDQAKLYPNSGVTTQVFQEWYCGMDDGRKPITKDDFAAITKSFTDCGFTCNEKGDSCSIGAASENSFNDYGGKYSKTKCNQKVTGDSGVVKTECGEARLETWSPSKHGPMAGEKGQKKYVTATSLNTDNWDGLQDPISQHAMFGRPFNATVQDKCWCQFRRTQYSTGKQLGRQDLNRLIDIKDENQIHELMFRRENEAWFPSGLQNSRPVESVCYKTHPYTHEVIASDSITSEEILKNTFVYSTNKHKNIVNNLRLAEQYIHHKISHNSDDQTNRDYWETCQGDRLIMIKNKDVPNLISTDKGICSVDIIQTLKGGFTDENDCIIKKDHACVSQEEYNDGIMFEEYKALSGNTGRNKMPPAQWTIKKPYPTYPYQWHKCSLHPKLHT